MANLIYNLPESAVTFAPSGGTVTMTLTSLANGAGRVSAQLDRGAGAHAGLYLVQVKTKAAAALAIGGQMLLYFLQGSVSADVPGNLGTADAAVASSDKQRNLGAPIIVVPVDSTTNGEPQISNSNIVEVYGRYVSMFVWNALGQALSGTAGDHVITLTPVPAQIQ